MDEENPLPFTRHYHELGIVSARNLTAQLKGWTVWKTFMYLAKVNSYKRLGNQRRESSLVKTLKHAATTYQTVSAVTIASAPGPTHLHLKLLVFARVDLVIDQLT